LENSEIGYKTLDKGVKIMSKLTKNFTLRLIVMVINRKVEISVNEGEK